ncbi:MAG: 23S rRNA (adenine(2503)-C(2))-methyltransferase RlmN [Ardenticatenaceae bacterium]|nr:23S rRNA (adenine(2503)-C(2))-methyltransferase RlmN [Ardenticatenaceae bacterium]
MKADSRNLNLHDFSLPELTALLQANGFSAYHAGQIWNYLYRQRARSLLEMVGLRPDLQEWLAENIVMTGLETAVSLTSSDNDTQKYLLRLADGQTVETVLMQFEGREGDPRATACISTQVGCAMGCVFCATGQMGFIRHLLPGEIVSQALYVDDILQAQGQRLRNIVLMGMGEPLHNYDNVMTAVSILTDHKGLSLAPKHITLSTVGVVPGIRRLADEARPIRLAVSLHGATDEERQALVPPAKRWPLAELMDACRYYIDKRQRRIFFEWTLIEGENDTPEQAHALGKLLHGMAAHVNLIPLNPTTGYDGQPTHSETAKQFQAVLADYGLPSTIRQRRGIDIAAGCGQLRAQS